MARALTLLLVAVTVGFAVIGCLLWFWTSALDLGDDSDPDYDLVQTVAAPGGSRVATIYVQSGGGALGYCYRCVGVQSPSADRSLDPKLADLHAVFVGACSDAVRVQWLNELHLEVTYSGSSHPLMKKSTDDAVVISYVRSSAPAGSSDGGPVSSTRAPNKRIQRSSSPCFALTGQDETWKSLYLDSTTYREFLESARSVGSSFILDAVARAR